MLPQTTLAKWDQISTVTWLRSSVFPHAPSAWFSPSCRSRFLSFRILCLSSNFWSALSTLTCSLAFFSLRRLFRSNFRRCFLRACLSNSFFFAKFCSCFSVLLFFLHLDMRTEQADTTTTIATAIGKTSTTWPWVRRTTGSAKETGFIQGCAWIIGSPLPAISASAATWRLWYLSCSLGSQCYCVCCFLSST